MFLLLSDYIDQKYKNYMANWILQPVQSIQFKEKSRVFGRYRFFEHPKTGTG